MKRRTYYFVDRANARFVKTHGRECCALEWFVRYARDRSFPWEVDGQLGKLSVSIADAQQFELLRDVVFVDGVPRPKRGSDLIASGAAIYFGRPCGRGGLH